MILEVNSLFKNVQAQSEVVYYTPVYFIFYKIWLWWFQTNELKIQYNLRNYLPPWERTSEQRAWQMAASREPGVGGVVSGVLSGHWSDSAGRRTDGQGWPTSLVAVVW